MTSWSHTSAVTRDWKLSILGRNVTFPCLADLKIIGLSLDNRLGDWKSVEISVIVILKSMDDHLVDLLFWEVFSFIWPSVN